MAAWRPSSAVSWSTPTARCLTITDQPIEGLFATGNVSGPFFGGVDYPMYIHGLSIGRALTTGYVAGRYVASL